MAATSGTSAHRWRSPSSMAERCGQRSAKPWRPTRKPDSVYRQTVLQAFREVADALRAIQHDAQTLQARTEAATQAEAAYQIAAQRYSAGGISQLALLERSASSCRQRWTRFNPPPAATPTPRPCCRRWAADGGTMHSRVQRARLFLDSLPGRGNAITSSCTNQRCLTVGQASPAPRRHGCDRSSGLSPW